jgi:serine/threonine-protein kinase
MPTPEQVGDRYQLFGEIARGGMGAVLHGRDVDLGRELAVKVLLEKHADRPQVVHRFIEEAQIGGQLQHPGVVPIYDIGSFGDRPYFTMKLVKGKDLAALLSERADPSEDRPRLLSIALQVARTLAYAHAKGVIHRDLKPANIMVGAFGEVQVMDWGLAKVLSEGGVAEEEQETSRESQRLEGATTIRTARSGQVGSGTDTEAGSLLGTPAYMPPEQANGNVALLDRRADVFGLGAILCEVLTGQPPYVGRSSEEVRRKAANGDLADALTRLTGCGAEEELLELTRSCLAPEAIDRPRDAQAVADRLTAYLDGVQARLHRAELAEAEARARAREEVKRRRLTLALAAVVLLALTLAGAGWLWVKADRDARLLQLTREVNDALNRATALREQAKAAPVGGEALFAQAQEQTHRALALAENGLADAALVTQVKQLQAELDEDEKDRTLLAALEAARLAQAETVVGENRFASERAVPLFREAFAAYGLTVGQGEPAAATARLRQRPAAIRQAAIAALEEWIDLAAHPRRGLVEPDLDWLRAVAAAAGPDEGWTRDLRVALEEKALAKRRAALEKLEREADLDKVPVSTLTRLAGRLQAMQAPASAVALLRRAQQRYPGDFWINHNLGLALHALPGEADQAVRYLTAAVALRPDSPGAHLNLGYALWRKGQLEGAIVCYRQAIRLDPKYAAAHANLGMALKDKGQLEEAIACWRVAIALDPKSAGNYSNLGVALEARGQREEAIASYHQAIQLDPEDATAHNNLGVALKEAGKLEEAIACYRQAIRLDPKFTEAHNNLGNALQAKKDLEGAIACYRQAIQLAPRDATVHINLGHALQAKQDLEGASACYRQAIRLDPKFATAHFNLGTALHARGQVEEAIACYRHAIQLDPKLAGAYFNLGSALRARGQLDEAIANYRRAIEIDPRNASAHNNLGTALKAKGQLEEAIACFRRAIALDPKLVLAHINLGHALADKGQREEAITCYRKAIALDPSHARAHYNLGRALDARGQLEEAIACYRKAIELEPTFPAARSSLARAQRLVTARDKLPAYRSGSYVPATTEERLALAEWCALKKLHHTAAGLYATAFAADPKLADDLNASPRYQAACQAALAAAGMGEDAAKLDAREQARLRQQALDWLRADLTLRQKQLQSAKPGETDQARAALRHWQQDADLAGIRDEAALAKLPAGEREACSRLWAEVAALLKSKDSTTIKEPKP